MSGFRVKANSSMRSLLHEVAIGFRPAITEKLPDIAHFLDLVQVQIRHDHLFLVARSFGNNLSARCAEIALAVELTNIPGLLAPNPVDGADKISVGDSMCGLFEFPQVFAKTCNRCRWIENDLSPVQSQGTC